MSGGAPRPKCPYGEPGDRLWVRETFTEYADELTEPDCRTILYRADESAQWKSSVDDRQVDGMEAEFNPLADAPEYAPRWRPSIHMPRWASRITLEVTDVRVERLQEISEEDARSEGVEQDLTVHDANGGPCYTLPFQKLWRSTYGVDTPKSWESNPWVWVIEFKWEEAVL